jgi:tRNA(adenine34) deaminase
LIRLIPATCMAALVLALSVATGQADEPPQPASVAVSTTQHEMAAQQEIDEIWSLLALAIAYKDWQTGTGRGHNIAALLVDPAGQPVYWARNDRFATDNGTDHSEVRLMRYYLDCPNQVQYLGEQSPQHYPGARAGQGFTLYTTLEPCVMCTGMMLMNRLTRAVFIQSDPDYGKVVERLNASTAAGWPPYPVNLDISQAQMPEAQALDSLYQRLGRKDVIIPFLRSDMAKQVFAGAEQRLRTFQSERGNQGLVKVASDYLDQVVDADFQPDPLKECPQTP